MRPIVHSLVDAGPAQGAVPLVTIQEDELGLVAIAEADGQGANARAAAQIVLDAVRGHLRIHLDLLQRFRQEPTDILRNEIITVLKEAVGRGGREGFALARRHRDFTGVNADILMLIGREAFAAHVGYGHIYLVRRELMHRLTLTWPEPDSQKAVADPGGEGQPVALLGQQPSVYVETLCTAFSPGDVLVVASSTVARSLDDRDIRPLVQALPPNQAVQGLLRLVRERTPAAPAGVVVVQVPGGEPAGLRSTASSRHTLLSRMPIFHYCSTEEIQTIAAVTTPQRIPKDSMVYRQGDAAQEILFIVSGEVVISRDGLELVRLGPGCNFGEMAVLDESRRSSSASTAKDTDVLVIRREAFFGLLRGNPNLAVKILWNMLLRVSNDLRRTTSRLAELLANGTTESPEERGSDLPW